MQGYHNPLYSQSLVMHIQYIVHVHVYLSFVKLSVHVHEISYTTMHVLITRHLLPSLELMDIPCSKDHLLKTSLLQFYSSTIGRQLLNNPLDVYDIYAEERTEQQRRKRMLLKWREEQGSGATYLKLFQVLKSCGYNDAADKVQQMATACKGMFIRGWTGHTCVY